MPKNFNQAQSKYYSNFNLKQAHADLKIKIVSLANTLIGYYNGREEELGKLIFKDGYTKEKIQAVLNEFINDFADEYATNRAQNFPFLDSIANKLFQVKEAVTKPTDSQFTQKTVEKWVKKALANVKLNDADKSEAQKVLTVTIKYLADYLKSLTDANYVNPNEVIGIMMQKMLTGQSIMSDVNALIKTDEKMSKDIETIVQVIKAFERGVITKKEALRLTGIAKQLAIAFGLLNEEVVQDTTNKVVQKQSTVLSSFVSDSFRTGQGQKGKIERDISDNKIILSIDSSSFDIGIDVKYHFSRNKANMRRYFRGALKNKKVSQIFNFIKPAEEVNKMMYLLVNSYFFGAEGGKDWYNTLMNKRSPYSIYGLLKIFNLLYAAVPASVGTGVSNSSLSRLGTAIKTDTRMIVAIDEKFMLMTKFLDIIVDKITAGGSASKITGLETFIEEALSSLEKKVIGSGKPRETSLYKNKIKTLKAQAKSRDESGYEILQTDIINPLFGSKLQH